MSPRTWIERIIDILEAIAEIQVFIHGLDFETFRTDSKTIRAIELDFIIIGEAASQIPEEVEEKHPEVPWHFNESNAKSPGSYLFLGRPKAHMGYDPK